MENTPQQISEGTAVVRVLATVLDRLVKANTQLSPLGQGEVTKFHALKAPGISILQYLERIYKYASCSTECFILALIYIDRLIQRHNFVLTELNVHRVVITAVLLAAKFFDDAYYNNAYYAKVGGVLGSEMNGLEVEFLFRINFSLHVKPDEFAKYQANLVSHAVGPDSSLGTVVSSYACHEEVSSETYHSEPPSPQTMSTQSTSSSLSPTCDYSNERRMLGGDNDLSNLYSEHWGMRTSITDPSIPQISKSSSSSLRTPSSQVQIVNETLGTQYHTIVSSSPAQIQYNTICDTAQHSNPHALVISNQLLSDSTEVNPVYPIQITQRQLPSLLRYNSFPYSSKPQDQYTRCDHQISNSLSNAPSGIRLSPRSQYVTEALLTRFNNYGVPNTLPGFVNEPLSANIANIT